MVAVVAMVVMVVFVIVMKIAKVVVVAEAVVAFDFDYVVEVWVQVNYKIVVEVGFFVLKIG